jgi:hypothetical protein
MHTSEVIYFGDPYGEDRGMSWHVETPAEVCVECSDGLAGRWVPVSFCGQQAVH